MSNSIFHMGGIAAAVGFLSLAATAPALAEKGSPFSKMAGNWRCVSGGCWVKPVGGDRERVSCRVSYNVGGGGTTMAQKITCKGGIDVSANSKVQMKRGGKVSGSWSSYNTHTGRVKGGASGIARSNKISLGISGSKGFRGAMLANVRGNRHTVTLYQTKNSKRYVVGKLSLKR